MGIYKRGRFWYVDYRVSGRRIRERVGPSKKLAAIVLGKRQVEVAEGRFLDRKVVQRTRFDEFAEVYLEYSRTNKRNFSRECYLMRGLRAAFGPRLLTEITSWDVERYKAQRIGAVAPATVNRDLTLLKHMFTKAIAWGRATTNPVKAVKYLREANTRVRYLTEDEEDRLLGECSPNLRGLVVTALHTGFRRGELLALRWDDVDFRTGLVTVQAAYTKNGERRAVPMTRTVTALLTELRRKRPHGEYVFEKVRGGRYLSPRNGFEAAVRRAGIRDFRFHDLRHTFASRLAMAGVGLQTVQELLGHKAMSMTLRYSHLSAAHRARAVSVLDRVVVSTDEAKTDRVEEESGRYSHTTTVSEAPASALAV